MAKASLVAAKQANNLEALNARVAGLETELGSLHVKLDALTALMVESLQTPTPAVDKPRKPKVAHGDVIRN